MSQLIPKNQIVPGEVFAMLIDDGSVFNLQFLQAWLGLTEQSVKSWCAKHNVRPVVQGRTWLFTGKTFRAALEANAEQAKHLGCAEGAALFCIDRQTEWERRALTLVHLIYRPGHKMTTRY